MITLRPANINTAIFMTTSFQATNHAGQKRALRGAGVGVFILPQKNNTDNIMDMY